MSLHPSPICLNVAQDSIQRHNLLAVRQSDRIDPEEHKPAKNPRKGRQMLSASALLRIAFGIRLLDPVKRRKRKAGRRDFKNPQGMSARACAEVFSSNHTHVQKCRNAVSAWLVERQEEVATVALGDAKDQVRFLPT